MEEEEEEDKGREDVEEDGVEMVEEVETEVVVKVGEVETEDVVKEVGYKSHTKMCHSKDIKMCTHRGFRITDPNWYINNHNNNH